MVINTKDLGDAFINTKQKAGPLYFRGYRGDPEPWNSLIDEHSN